MESPRAAAKALRLGSASVLRSGPRSASTRAGSLESPREDTMDSQMGAPRELPWEQTRGPRLGLPTVSPKEKRWDAQSAGD